MRILWTFWALSSRIELNQFELMITIGNYNDTYCHFCPCTYWVQIRFVSFTPNDKVGFGSNPLRPILADKDYQPCFCGVIKVLHEASRPIGPDETRMSLIRNDKHVHEDFRFVSYSQENVISHGWRIRILLHRSNYIHNIWPTTFSRSNWVTFVEIAIGNSMCEKNNICYCNVNRNPTHAHTGM